jgi:sulfoxide reductase heme-binding subunit YedZ
VPHATRWCRQPLIAPPEVSTDLILWYAARAAALAAFFVLAASLLTGMAIRTAYLAPVARNRTVVAVHGFLTWFWLPLVGVHVSALVLDVTSRITPLDLLIPFRVNEGAGSQLAIGLGTVSLLLLVLIAATSALRRLMRPFLWRWIHRLTYPMFGIFLIHAQLAGTDFSQVAISLTAWATLGGLLALALLRAAGGRMSTEPPV